MWQLIKIESENIVSFKKMDYTINQGCATLIFGQNNDSDKQKNNGSGKSSFVEAVSFGITGEPLRKVNMDEIINDYADEAWVRLYFQNQETEFVVYRSISRSRGQVVECMTRPLDSANSCAVSQASVSDFNKYILEMLGFTKTELYNSYILCANKYKSFFRVSDREKKEIINKFSNGILVDESLEKLATDIEPVLKEQAERQLSLRAIEGKLEAIDEQITEAEYRNASQQQTKEEKIKSYKATIEQKQTEIAYTHKDIRMLKDKYNSISDLEDEVAGYEQSDKGIGEIYDKINASCTALGISIPDYKVRSERYSSEYDGLKTKRVEIRAKVKEIQQKVTEAGEKLKSATEYREKAKKRSDDLYQEEQNKTDELYKIESELQTKMNDIRTQLEALDEKNTNCAIQMGDLEAILHGVITCPKCSHQFILNKDMDLDTAKKELAKCKEMKVRFEQQKTECNEKMTYYKSIIAKNEVERADINKKQSERTDFLSKCYRSMIAARNAFENVQSELSSAEFEQKNIGTSLINMNEKIVNLRKDMFNDIFSATDKAADDILASIKRNEGLMAAYKANIETYEKSIAELESASSDNIVESLKESKIRYNSERLTALNELDKVNAHLDILKRQEQHFIEFKSYLANTKINAISQITNSFLEQIGSDLRLELSGYKMLKSSKLRENITVRVLRNGVDCGSFDKLSGGERARVMLANILAMHSLTNSNCDYNKGLDLLIIDEVLDCSDESGIASYCDVFNSLGVTSMVITQGLVSESYSHKLLVVKENGISTII